MSLSQGLRVKKREEEKRARAGALQAEPALTSCPGSPGPGSPARPEEGQGSFPPAQTWEAEEPESAGTNEEGSLSRCSAQGTGAGQEREAGGWENSALEVTPEGGHTQPSGAVGSEGSSQGCLSWFWNMKDFIQRSLLTSHQKHRKQF